LEEGIAAKVARCGCHVGGAVHDSKLSLRLRV
jgi:hypothetical protein